MKRVLPLLLGLTACLSPASGRYAKDQLVGAATSADLEVSVADHAAAVRFLGEDGDHFTLTLWAGTPTLGVTLTNPSATARPVRLRVQNTFADAALAIDGAAPVAGLPGITLTERRWDLTLQPGQTMQLAVAPPDAATRAPFRFAVLSDIQDAVTRVDDLFRPINQDEQIRFVIGAGDLTNDGTFEEMEVFQAKLADLGVPYFATVGNHDISSPSLPWYEHFGKASQHFVFKGVSFSLVDDASATIDRETYAALDGWLAADEPLFEIVAMHVPALDPVGTRNGAMASRDEATKFLALLAKHHVALSLYGHIHSYYAYSNAGIPAYISGGGGAIPERLDGIGRHFLSIDVDPVTHQANVSKVEVDVP